MTVTTRTVLIAGGGPVGSVLALALSRGGIDVTLVEQRSHEVAFASAVPMSNEHQSVVQSTHADGRPIALSASSVRILQTLDVWQQIATRACPIQMVHVGEQGHFGAVRLRASEYRVPALGYVTDARIITAALESAVEKSPQIQWLRGTQVDDVLAISDRLSVRLDAPGNDGKGLEHEAQLLVVADGGHSSLCANLGIDFKQHDYQQSAVVCSVKSQRKHQDIAYERFTRRGPLALLPMLGGDCAVVWTLPHDDAAQIAALGDVDFAQELQSAFGHRLGRLHTAGARTVFPLCLVRAQQLAATRAVVIGNAANRLHPVAGQGLNLGLRDAAVLADLVVQAARVGEDLGGNALLQSYAGRRHAEHRNIVRFTDVLARGFSSGPQSLGWLRSAGMLALNLLPAARHGLARYAMGLKGAQARMVRGLNP